MDNETYYTPEEIAEQFKVTSNAVRQWIRQGQLKFVMLGSVYRISQSALDEFLNTPRTPRGRKRKVAKTSATS